MVLFMTRPRKHPKTGVYEFRKRVPERLRALVGKSEVKRSLRTKDPALARERHGFVAAEGAGAWAALERAEGVSEARAPAPLRRTHKQIVALAGEFYRAALARRRRHSPWRPAGRRRRADGRGRPPERGLDARVDDMLVRRSGMPRAGARAVMPTNVFPPVLAIQAITRRGSTRSARCPG
ncbi:DUF6538 domain-containing protein [Salinarimonas sp.]|uniref:DUF6538 domain-containing protein n=1 Tax=Salinarimonas sp. TaxID=2766526 RepID=UPI0032D92EA6